MMFKASNGSYPIAMNSVWRRILRSRAHHAVQWKLFSHQDGWIKKVFSPQAEKNEEEGAAGEQG